MMGYCYCSQHMTAPREDHGVTCPYPLEVSKATPERLADWLARREALRRGPRRAPPMPKCRPSEHVFMRLWGSPLYACAKCGERQARVFRAAARR